MALPFLQGAQRILDIGTHDGTLFEYLSKANRGNPSVTVTGVGIDPKLVPGKQLPGICLIEGFFPEALAEAPVDNPSFNAIAMLAVLEHIPREQQQKLAVDCHDCLETGGRVIITTPSPLVDKILDVLFFLKIVDAMGETHDEHYGFEPSETIGLFESKGFRLIHQSRFELGLNHLYVFEK